MTLREKAEAAAREAIAKWDDDSDGTPSGFRKHVASAMEAFAREFAEAAIKEYLKHRWRNALVGHVSDAPARIFEAIEAAEKDGDQI